MALCTCDFCGKPFNSIGAKICPECIQQLDCVYIKVRKYIYQNPEESTFASVIEHTEVPEKFLSYLISQGRIILEDRIGTGTARCRACGRIVSSGPFCDSCRQKLAKEKWITEEKKARINPLWGTERNR